MTGAKQWDTDCVVCWLESPEGEAWSRDVHMSIPGFLMSVVDDFENQIPAILWYLDFERQP